MLNVTEEYQHLSAEEILINYRENANGDAVMCLNVTGDMNIGMIIRTATIFEMSKVYLVGKRQFDKRTAVGMSHYIDIEKISATNGIHNESLDINIINNLLTELEKKYQIVMVEQGGSPLRLIHNSVVKTKPALFVLGNEGIGIPIELLNLRKETKETKDIIISIPQKGIVRSFNVSNAFSIVAYEYYR